MKKLLIIYPHWPPSNLAGVHRSRLIANFSKHFGWDVIVLTVNELYYEETLDPDLCKLIRPHVKVIKTKALPVLKLFRKRLIGDIGLRSWFHLKYRMLELLDTEKVDFIWIPIPSWYTSLLGKIALRKFNIQFGIDYIDPWVYKLTSSEKTPLSRQWLTRQVAILLEPIAIRNAALISGVSSNYFRDALSRSFAPSQFPKTISMPYGFDIIDHTIEPTNPTFPFDPSSGDYILYAGAYLPHSEQFIKVIFEVVKELDSANNWPPNLKFQFVGTGSRKDSSISKVAKEKGISNIVQEHPERYPFLVVQHLLRHARFNLIIGSTEPHYTASKTFQCILAKRPIFAILHENSSAVRILQETEVDRFTIRWSESNQQSTKKNVAENLQAILSNLCWTPNLNAINKYSAQESAKVLFEGIDLVLNSTNTTLS